MTDTSSFSMWRELGKNLLLSLGLFVALFLLCYVLEVTFGLSLLHFFDAAFCVGIPASVVGVGYVLTIRNPANYTGFWLGILMSLLLAVQFFLQGNYDLSILYVACFVPFQIKSICTWKKAAGNHTSEALEPAFLPMKQMLVSAAVFVVIILLDYLLATFVINHDTLRQNVAVKLMGAMLIASSILANYWLIYKKNDAWIYWVVYSFSGVVFYILVNNIFSVVLFGFFLVINSMAGISWYKNTTQDNKGWLSCK